MVFCWTGFLLSSRLSVGQGFMPWDVAALRYIGSFLGGSALALVLGWPKVAPARAAALVASAGFAFPLCALAGVTFAPASHMAVFMPGCLPFIIAAAWALCFGERWTGLRFVSLGVVGLGVALLAAGTLGAWPGAWRGDLLFLAGGVGWVVYMVLVRRWGLSAVEATLCVALGAAPAYLWFWWLFLPSKMAQVGWGAIAWQLVYQGLFAMLAAGLLFTRAMNVLGGPTTSTITAVVPAMTALGAWPLLGEPLSAAAMAGVAVVTAGMLLGVRAAAKPALR